MARARVTRRQLTLAVGLVVATPCGCSLLVDGTDLVGGAPRDADGVDASRDAVGDIDADTADAGDEHVEQPNLGISCGLHYCDPGAQLCCVGKCTNAGRCDALPDGGASVCAGANDDTCGWRILRCDDTVDCNPGGGTAKVCCGIGGDSTCVRLVDCRVQAHVVFCDPFGTNPCPGGAACVTPDGGRAMCSGL